MHRTLFAVILSRILRLRAVLVFLARKLALNSRGILSEPAMHLVIPFTSIQME